MASPEEQAPNIRPAPCDCIEWLEGYPHAAKCDCGNRGDHERIVQWCADFGHQMTIIKLQQRIERLEMVARSLIERFSDKTLYADALATHQMQTLRNLIEDDEASGERG